MCCRSPGMHWWALVCVCTASDHTLKEAVDSQDTTHLSPEPPMQECSLTVTGERGNGRGLVHVQGLGFLPACTLDRCFAEILRNAEHPEGRFLVEPWVPLWTWQSDLDLIKFAHEGWKGSRNAAVCPPMGRSNARSLHHKV